jgi:hypothetical protein
MAREKASELTKQLFEKVAGIKLNDAAAIFGTTSKESMLQELRKNVAELGAAISAKKPYDQIMKLYESMAGSVDTAGVTGLISEEEIIEYYSLIDKLWIAIEKEMK